MSRHVTVTQYYRSDDGQIIAIDEAWLEAAVDLIHEDVVTAETVAGEESGEDLVWARMTVTGVHEGFERDDSLTEADYQEYLAKLNADAEAAALESAAAAEGDAE